MELYSKIHPIRNNLSHRNDSDDLNMIDMLLGLKSNNCNKKEKILNLYEEFSEIKRLCLSKKFIESLKNSQIIVKDYYYLKKQILNLKENDKNSFLVLPIHALGHMMGGYIRKTDEGYDFFLLNKGLRFFHEQCEEFVFHENNVGKLIESIQLSGLRKHYSIEQVYDNFYDLCDNSYKINMVASNQKVGNCYVKNIEFAIKVADVLSDVSKQDISNFRNNYDEQPLKLKWRNASTYHVHKNIAASLMNKYPRIKNEIKNSIICYTKNKCFGKNIKLGLNPIESVVSAFEMGTIGNVGDISQEHLTSKNLKKYLKQITPYNFCKYRDELSKVVDVIQDTNLTDSFEDMMIFFEKAQNYSRNKSFCYYLNSGLDPVDSLIKVFEPKDKSNNSNRVEKATILLSELNSETFEKQSKKLKQIFDFCNAKEINFKTCAKESSKDYKDEILRAWVTIDDYMKFFTVAAEEIQENINEFKEDRRNKIV